MNGHFLPRKSKFVFLNNSIDRVTGRTSRLDFIDTGERSKSSLRSIRNGFPTLPQNLAQFKAPQILNASTCAAVPDSSQSKIVFDTKTAVKTLAIRPITSVTAKPFTGPVPNINRNAQETTVVT